jgi:hypothetical protein
MCHPMSIYLDIMHKSLSKSEQERELAPNPERHCAALTGGKTTTDNSPPISKLQRLRAKNTIPRNTRDNWRDIYVSIVKYVLDSKYCVLEGGMPFFSGGLVWL